MCVCTLTGCCFCLWEEEVGSVKRNLNKTAKCSNYSRQRTGRSLPIILKEPGFMSQTQSRSLSGQQNIPKSFPRVGQRVMLVDLFPSESPNSFRMSSITHGLHEKILRCSSCSCTVSSDPRTAAGSFFSPMLSVFGKKQTNKQTKTGLVRGS